jgi:acyl-CoA reductase-like NAD-dependent aldehyde dehydrogenase
MGKPINDMVTIDVPAAARNFEYFGELIDKIDGSVTNTAADAFHYILREPLGVVGCIVPWNYPLLMAAWKVGPALAAGNSVVLKPAEQSPLVGLLMAQLFIEAGGPPGVFNVVNGWAKRRGAALALHNDVAKIAFTGSTEIGKQMLIYAGQSNMKRVSLECGGKTPQIFPGGSTRPRHRGDLRHQRHLRQHGRGVQCRLAPAARQADCRRISRPLHRARPDTHIGPGIRSILPPTLGPLVTQEHRRRVLGYIARGQSEGREARVRRQHPGHAGLPSSIRPYSPA